MVDVAKTEQAALDAANNVKAWYKRSSFWGQAVAGAIIWQLVRVLFDLFLFRLPF